MQVRRLAASDAPAYRPLRLRALREHPEAFTSSHEENLSLPLAETEKRLASATISMWGAFQAGVLCGAIGLERETRIKNRHKASLVAMYVAPEHAGLGVGRALVDALVREARTEGLELLVLTVTAGNASATHLYESAGFRSFGIEPRAIKVDGQAFAKNHMYLELSPR
ncbi:GNAT family N-acetyltransferase [uncultured Ramlibacter sp.]|uniref:GNAT family N-acetyltransferase n=1 Tax=uncultured Ramlibacter sp. TaxID=260755 RepID=UPI002628CE31|nr:GNAT family N-acetyltransferase [uncultured Ramlibacter sp.]